MKYDENIGDIKFSHKIDDPAVMMDGFEKHFHSSYELLLFLDGDLEFVLENRIYKLKPYDLMFIKPGEHHYVNILSNKRYERMVFRFPESFIPPELVDILNDKPNLFKIGQTRVIEVFRKFDTYYSEIDGDKHILIYKAKIQEILILLSVLDGYISTPLVVDPAVEKVVNYINKNLFEHFSIDDLCDMFYISRSQLYKSFVDVMKVPIASYIRNKRVLSAHQLIINGHRATDIFYKCGFDYYSTFYRSYVKVMGHSPSGEKQKKRD